MPARILPQAENAFHDEVCLQKCAKFASFLPGENAKPKKKLAFEKSFHSCKNQDIEENLSVRYFQEKENCSRIQNSSLRAKATIYETSRYEGHCRD